MGLFVVGNRVRGSMRTLITVLLLVLLGWWWHANPDLAVDELDGHPALAAATVSFDHRLSLDRPPLQSTENLGIGPIRVEDFVLTPVARFETEARVLGRANYRYGTEARLSPMDLALGWGPMADPAVLEEIDISQGGRFYRWRVERFPIPRETLETSSANVHIVPAGEGVRRSLDRIEEDQVVRLRGWLIDVERQDGWRWRSSRTRDDTGAGACEILLVNRVHLL
jgi:hypothetical protein